MHVEDVRIIIKLVVFKNLVPGHLKMACGRCALRERGNTPARAAAVTVGHAVTGGDTVLSGLRFTMITVAHDHAPRCGPREHHHAAHLRNH